MRAITHYKWTVTHYKWTVCLQNDSENVNSVSSAFQNEQINNKYLLKEPNAVDNILYVRIWWGKEDKK